MGDGRCVNNEPAELDIVCDSLLIWNRPALLQPGAALNPQDPFGSSTFHCANSRILRVVTSYKLAFCGALPRAYRNYSRRCCLPLNKDVLWYKDAIIYQVHVRTFYDSNGDGIGDFQGLEEKLDYLQELGISAIWLMPFFPSPLRDDGYDIAD